MSSNGNSRKTFLKKIGAASLAVTGAPFLAGMGKHNSEIINLKPYSKKIYSSNDRIQIALIGAGWMGQVDAQVAARYDGAEIVAACDLYDARLDRCKELFGDDIFTTRDYRECIERDDIDAVIVATSDHWHDTITIDALRAGKAVYCEKPMVQTIEEGHSVIGAEKETGLPLIIGSQGTSSLSQQKAVELYREGAIGELNYVEAYIDRFSHMGAWQYSIPPSASPQNIDWDTYLKDTADIPFDAKRFFRYRNYKDYGTGIPGDLFVHLLSELHNITGSMGPNKIAAMGGLRFWDDGRDVPDIMLGMFEYPDTEAHPAFNLTLRSNFTDGSGGGRHVRLVGSEGEMVLAGGTIILRQSKLPERPGMSINNFSEEVQREYAEYYKKEFPEQKDEIIEPSVFEYRTPEGFNSRYEHFLNFYDAIRNGTKLLQDGEFGLRAAAPALACNISQERGEIIHWDPKSMKII